jgi:putative ABC transport system permease protein
MRLRDEATRSRALAAVDAAVRQDGIAGAARADSLAPQGGPLLVLILCAIGFVLLIACTNVANVVLARGTGRRYELGVRAALGATRGQLFGYQIAEGTILAALAVGVGVLASAWLLDGLVALIPVDGLPSWLEFRMDARVLAWIGGTGITAVLVSAALPAWTLLRGAPGALVSDSGTRSIGDRGAGRLRSGLVAVQVALATVLLAGAALLVQTFTALRTVDPGYDAASVLEVPVRRPAEAPGFERLVEEGASSLRALPAAAEAAVAAPPLLRGQLEAPESGRRSFAMTESVSPEYPAALGLALERGRTFASWDEPGAILLSAALATALFDSPEAALGATVRFSGDGRRLTVIGIVADRFAPMGDGTEGTSPVPQAYLPLSLGDRAEPRFLIRASGGDVLALAAPAAAALRRLDPDASVGTTQTRQRIEQAGSGDDIVFFATVFTAFGAIALLLASLGIYGVVAFTASKRTREIGVRVALGANPRQVLALVLGGVAPAGGVGLGFGVAGAFGLGQGLRGVLYGVGPADPKTMIGLPVVFAIVTLIAALAPARRASRLDPLEALRAD